MAKHAVIFLLLLGGCSAVSTSQPDAAPPMPPDASPPPPDATPVVHGEPRQLVSGSRRIAGGAFTMDVQIGHAFDQGRVSGGPWAADGAATIK